MFGVEALRRVRDSDGASRNFRVADYAHKAWRARQALQPGQVLPFPDCGPVAARDQLLMQAAVQPFVDGAIAKTIRLAPEAARGSVAELLESAYQLGLKGCTVFRETSRPAVIEPPPQTDPRAHGRHCCDLERESD